MKKCNCDNCGAPIKIGHTATCEWCKTDYVNKEPNSDGVRPPTGDDFYKDSSNGLLEKMSDIERNLGIDSIDSKKELSKFKKLLLGGGGDTGAR